MLSRSIDDIDVPLMNDTSYKKYRCHIDRSSRDGLASVLQRLAAPVPGFVVVF